MYWHDQAGSNMIWCQHCGQLHKGSGDCRAPANVLARIKYKDWTFFLPPDESYLQIHFSAGGTKWHGRKWRLSRHMTTSEIVQTALKAVLAAEEHEAREAFTYRGHAIFGPHLNVESLVTLCNDSPRAVRKEAA